MKVTKKKIGEPEHRSMEINQTKEQKEKYFKKKINRALKTYMPVSKGH